MKYYREKSTGQVFYADNIVIPEDKADRFEAFYDPQLDYLHRISSNSKIIMVIVVIQFIFAIIAGISYIL